MASVLCKHTKRYSGPNVANISTMPLSILHIAPQNIAGVPFEIVKEERRRGINSLLVTICPHPYGFGEDECLDLPFAAGRTTRFLQRVLGTTPAKSNKRRRDPSEIPPKWNGDKFPANLLFSIRDRIWEPKLRKAGFPERLEEYDIVVLDGGIPLLRSGNWILRWAERGGHLATTYYGTDLRQHGVIPAIDNASGAVFVMEFDHRFLHPRAVWLPFPFDPTVLPRANPPKNGSIRIGHAAAYRPSKGTDTIYNAIREVGKKYSVEPVIIERLPHKETLELKSTCDIFIDQLGELGYGISALESLAMGIPTIVELLPDHEEFIGDHPFVVANSENLPDILAGLVEDDERRKRLSEKGRRWVEEFHNPARAVNIILEKYRNLGWFAAKEVYEK